jgi:hypothetical protein
MCLSPCNFVGDLWLEAGVIKMGFSFPSCHFLVLLFKKEKAGVRRVHTTADLLILPFDSKIEIFLPYISV